MEQPKIDFSGLAGPAKRRRLRSGGNVSSLPRNNEGTNQQAAEDAQDPANALKTLEDGAAPGTTQTSKSCKGATTIPIFL